MFNETTSGLGDSAKDYAAICRQYPSRPKCKEHFPPSGRPPTSYGVNPLPNPGTGGSTTSDSGSASGGGSATGGGLPAPEGSSESASGGSFLSGTIAGIPIMYLIIGAGLLLVMKK